MLRSMREGAKSPVMKVFLLFLAAGFALWGVGDLSSGFFSSGNKAVTAGSQSATAVEVANEFERVRRTAPQRLPAGEAIELGLLDEVINTTARQILFEAEADALGLASTKQMQLDRISAEPVFQSETGGFSEARFRQTLGQSGLTEQAYLDRLDSLMLQEQILGSINSGARFSADLTRSVAAYQLEKRTARYRHYQADNAQVTSPSDAVLSEYYAENGTSYDAPDLRQVDVVYLSADTVADQIVVTEADITDAFETRRDEFIEPERREVRQMVFATKAAADSALALLADGTGFAEVATETLNWTETDTALGIVSRSDLDDALAAAVFSSAQDEVVGPVETAFGFHLAITDSITEGTEAVLSELRPSIITILKSEAAIDTVYDLVSKLEDELGTGASLAEAAASISMNVTTLPQIDRNGLDIDGMSVSQGMADAETAAVLTDSQFLALSFELEIDKLSPVITSVDDSFFVLQPKAESPSRSRALDEVRDRVIADWTREQALQAARQRAEQAQSEFAATLSEFSVSPEFERSGTGLDDDYARLIATTSFAASPGTTSLVDTGDGTLLVYTDTVIPADAEDITDRAEQLGASFDELIASDMQAALGLELADRHQLEVNVSLVRQLLIGASGQ